MLYISVILIFPISKSHTNSRMFFNQIKTFYISIFAFSVCGMHLWEGKLNQKRISPTSNKSDDLLQEKYPLPSIEASSCPEQFLNDPELYHSTRSCGINHIGNSEELGSNQIPEIHDASLILRLGRSYDLPHVQVPAPQNKEINGGCVFFDFFRKGEFVEDNPGMHNIKEKCDNQRLDLKRNFSQDFEDPNVDVELDLGLGGPKMYPSKRAKRLHSSGDVSYSTINPNGHYLTENILENHHAPSFSKDHVTHNTAFITNGILKGPHRIVALKVPQNTKHLENIETQTIQSTGGQIIEGIPGYENYDTLKNIHREDPFILQNHKENDLNCDSIVSTDFPSLAPYAKEMNRMVTKSHYNGPLAPQLSTEKNSGEKHVAQATQDYFSGVVIEPESGESHGIWLCNNILNIVSFENDKHSIPYHLFILTHHCGTTKASIAKWHVVAQQRITPEDRVLHIKKTGSNIQQRSLGKKIVMEKIDWVISRITQKQTKSGICLSLEGNPKKPLSFLQSVGHVKIDLLPELKNQIDSWFLGLRNNMFSKVKVSAPIKSKIHHVLAKVHGQMVLGIMGAFVMMNNEAKHKHPEANMLKDCWNCIKEHIDEWKYLSSSGIMKLCKIKPNSIHKAQTAMVPSQLLEFLFQVKSDTPLSCGCVWDLVIQFLQLPIFQGIKEAPAPGYFEKKLRIIKHNMKVNQIAGISHSRLSYHLFESTLKT